MKLLLGKVFGDINHQINLLITDKLHSIRTLMLIGPVQKSGIHTILGKKLMSAASGIQVVAVRLQHAGTVKQLNLRA